MIIIVQFTAMLVCYLIIFSNCSVIETISCQRERQSNNLLDIISGFANYFKTDARSFMISNHASSASPIPQQIYKVVFQGNTLPIVHSGLSRPYGLKKKDDFSRMLFYNFDAIYFFTRTHNTGCILIVEDWNINFTLFLRNSFNNVNMGNSFIFILVHPIQEYNLSPIEMFKSLETFTYKSVFIIYQNHNVDSDMCKHQKFWFVVYHPFIDGGRLINITSIKELNKHLATNKQLNMRGQPFRVNEVYGQRRFRGILGESGNYDDTGDYTYTCISVLAKQVNASMTITSNNNIFDFLSYEMLDNPFPLPGFFFYLYPHEVDELKIIVPKSFQIPYYMKMLRPFTTETWVVYLSVFVITTVIWKLLNIPSFGEDSDFRGSVLLEMFRSFIVGEIKFNPVRLFHRFFIISSLALSVLVTNMYAGLVTSFMTVPCYYPEIDSLGTFLSSGLKLSVHESQGMIIGSFFRSVDFTKGYPETSNMTDEELADFAFYHIKYHEENAGMQLVVNNRSFGRLTYLSRAEYALNDGRFYSDGYPQIHVMKQYLGIINLSFMVIPKYIQTMNVLMRKITEAGLYNKWKKEVLFKKSLTSKRGTKSRSLNPLNIKHMKAPLILLLIGVAIGAIIFIGEVIYKYRKFFKISQTFN